jgi:hypothetical protein
MEYLKAYVEQMNIKDNDPSLPLVLQFDVKVSAEITSFLHDEVK